MIYKNINWLSVNKISNGKKSSKKKWSENKQYNTKTNKRISKSNLPQRKMTLNEEWYKLNYELNNKMKYIAAYILLVLGRKESICKTTYWF